MEKGPPNAISANGKIMVNAELFQKINPNYTRPSINIPQELTAADITPITWNPLPFTIF